MKFKCKLIMQVCKVILFKNNSKLHSSLLKIKIFNIYFLNLIFKMIGTFIMFNLI